MRFFRGEGGYRSGTVVGPKRSGLAGFNGSFIEKTGDRTVPIKLITASATTLAAKKSQLLQQLGPNWLVSIKLNSYLATLMTKR